MNPRIELAVRNAACDQCQMAEFATGKNRCVTAKGSSKADVLVVTKFPPTDKAIAQMTELFQAAGFTGKELAFTGAIKCVTYESEPTKDNYKVCRQYLDAEVDFIKPKYIMTMGNEALTAVTGRSGIMKWRGKFAPHTSKLSPRVTRVLPTVATAAVLRNPSQAMNLTSDIQFLYNHLHDVAIKHALPDKSEYIIVDTKDKLATLLGHLRTEAYAAAFDIESNGFDETRSDSFCVTFSITTIRTDAIDPARRSTSISDAPMTCWAIPLHHRASRWSQSWEKVMHVVCGALRQVPIRIAHNAKFDCRWLEEFGGGVPATFDTMLAAHLLNENRVKGLKPLAQILLGAEPWDIKISGSRGVPWYNKITLKNILWYNGLDTWHTMRLWKFFRLQLIEQPRIAAIFLKLMMPGSRALVHVERRGVWVDRPALETNSNKAADIIADIENQLLDYVNVTTPMEVNWNPSGFLRWFIFTHLKLPVIKMGKSGPSVSEPEVLSKLVDHHPAIKLLMERSKWNKIQTGFFTPYKELIDEEDRLRTTFKITGTVTGRLSSGKADLDKVTGAKQTRGVNLQQVPRDTLVRGVFGAPPGWTWLEADYSQIELRIAAWLADEPTMLTLYASGQDIHMAMAMRMTGKPASKVTSEERKKAKAVNFGFLYGMGWAHFIETAWNNYGVIVNEQEAQAFRKAFFDEFPALLKWHARQRRLVRQYKRVESPLGRVRHLPDIDSPDHKVAAEAERQAINSPVQAMASDLTLLSMIRLEKEFRRRDMSTRSVGTVHDAINFEVPNDEVDMAISLIQKTMQNPPLERLFGVRLTVPIVADIKVGERWGTGREL